MFDGVVIELAGGVVRGHRVASGLAEDSPFEAGTIALQTPHFAALGLDLSPFHPATLNVSIAPHELTVLDPHHTFRQVRWSEDAPAEDFSFLHAHIDGLDALLYLPHPDTKPAHHQPPSVVEVLAPFLPGVTYGSRVTIGLDPRRVRVD